MSRNAKRIESPLRLALSGHYKLETFKTDESGNEIPGTREVKADWFDNLITNKGLDMIGYTAGNVPSSSYEYMRGCQVGAGSTAPAFTDTALVSRINSTVNRLSVQDGRDLSNPTARYAYHRMVYRFSPGSTSAAGNVSEIGVVGGVNDGSSAGGALFPTADLFSRALVLDGGGSPTTVTVLSDETLDVTYEVRVYVPNSDATGTVTLNGSVYNWTVRASDIDQGPAVNGGGWGSPSPNNPAVISMSLEPRQSVGFGENAAYVGASSAIGLITDEPSGTKCGIGSSSSTGSSSVGVIGGYTEGNHYVDVNHFFDLGPAPGANINNVDGIGAMRLCLDCCSFQMGFSPRPVKTPDMKLNIVWRVSWARYTP